MNEMTTLRVGIVGVGLMGHGIAKNVLARGSFPLAFLDHPGNQPVDDLLSLRATACKTPGEVASASDVIILCVTGSPQVEAILTGEAGVLSGLRKGTIIVDCSTALPDSTLRMAAAVEAAGGRFLDAPMTRTARHAEEGTLNLLVGGDEADLRSVRAVLASFTEGVEHVGPVGFGHRLKLLHNYVSIGFMALLGEAAAQAADAGVDPAVFVDVLAKGGGAGVALQRMAPAIVTGDTGTIPFFIDNALKDISYYRMMASNSGASKAIADGVGTAIAAVVESGHGQAYISDLARLLRKTKPAA
ncbi:NAD(P)-dependent oxidoreductase [Bradyrhizobium sp. WBAH42]|nr:NAD(P)-dependent oxidoreductase [Bradyrhizobium sp. WBAH30]MDD1543890.1 NAD(P)-dependent oxidoreductase [Bradyrhizobium sp. WBAH41]MDD1557825.1 NAD(P)-dependent oxidoreductase [Bradyrhizobium sp. WBAH23]MDD1565238.1 NAD(P)-dependent oxidoreductase [Bradyrhizobium sp. WBAH33]MDD1592271.1 NAD(P)-dependent oxidoreductase [Bradyrhizobium sp. WBAH42]NRB88350.1 NAD(P)-dependent oxidoreductase [Bradyrhizobium sp. WBAH10]QCJ88481.1 NAD(P)-dependent oxidoreductase [Bradyrhizobium yuanmingense]